MDNSLNSYFRVEKQGKFRKETRKYPLCRYILGVPTHITAYDRHWEGDETLKRVLIYAAQLCLA